MKLEDIFAEWEKDSTIDPLEFTNESVKTSKLHHKYLRWLADERLLLKKYQSDLKQLELDKHEFYTLGPTPETKDLGWKMPARGMVLKQDLPMYMQGDQEIINMSLKIGMQEEKVEVLKSILVSVNNRGYQIKNGIDFLRFTNGG
jgi:hypothetical protein